MIYKEKEFGKYSEELTMGGWKTTSVMTQEDRDILYDRDTYGMCKFYFEYKDEIEKVLEFNEQHPDTTMIDVYIDKEELHESTRLFNWCGVVIYLLYHERTLEGTEDLKSVDSFCIDSDSYDLKPERIKELKEKTKENRLLIKKLLELNDEFISTIS